MYERQEKEISFKSMLFSVVYHWKSVLLVGLVLAILLGGYKAVKTQNISNSEEKEEAYQEYLLALSDYEQSLDRVQSDIQTLEQRIRDQEEFLSNSILMTLDSYHVGVVRARFHVASSMPEQIDGDKTVHNPTEELLAAYQMLLGGDSAMESYARELGVQSRYLKEIITVSGTASQGLDITVWHKDTDSADRILKVILSHMNETTQQITESIGEHTIAEIGTTAGTGVDLSMAKRQDENKNYLYSMQDELALKKEKLKTIKAPAEIVESGKIDVKAIAKSGIKGGILGVLLMAVIYCCSYVFGDKVYSGEEVQVRTGVKVLGVFAVAPASKDPIIRWLRKKERRARFDAEENMKLFVQCVKNADRNGRSILVTGDVGSRMLENTASKMQEVLGQDYRVQWGSLLADPETADRLLACDFVVLVEKSGKSRYSSVKHQVELAHNVGKTVIGTLVAE